MALCPVVSCSALTWKRAIFVLDYGHCFLLIACKRSLGASGYRETPPPAAFVLSSADLGVHTSASETARQTHRQRSLSMISQPFNLSRQQRGIGRAADLLRLPRPCPPCSCHHAPSAEPQHFPPAPQRTLPLEHVRQRGPQCSGPARPCPARPTPPRAGYTTAPSPAPGALTEHEVVWPENLAEGPGAHRVHGAGLQVHQHGAGHVLATCKTATSRDRDCGGGGHGRRRPREAAATGGGGRRAGPYLWPRCSRH